jgi:hypothetical protein
MMVALVEQSCCRIAKGFPAEIGGMLKSLQRREMDMRGREGGNKMNKNKK